MWSTADHISVNFPYWLEFYTIIQLGTDFFWNPHTLRHAEIKFFSLIYKQYGRSY